jgi:small conductance mechanosensitive channel
MLLSLFMAAFAAQVADDGFSKLQIFLQQLIDWGVNAGGRIIGAIIIFVVGRFLISLLRKMLARLLAKRHVDASIQSFVKSLVNILLTILLIIAVIGKLGVETTSFAALLASAGVAIGMALSGNLQNFAGGLIVLLFRPFKVGDWIESQGVSGTVREIQIFHTILTTADNKVIYIPNGALSSGTVTNYSREDTRRVDWVIGVEYGENYDKVESTVRRIISEDSRMWLFMPWMPAV